jgi:hypothetical protein
MDAKVSFHGVSVDHPAEGEHVPRLGAKHYVAEVHRAFDSSRLVRSLKMPGQGITVLHDLDRVCARLPVVAMGVDHPGAGNVCRGTIVRWQLLAKTYMAERQQQEEKQSER